jgi:tRNA A37 threonylcarbamoyltransferase TsaD
VDLYFPPPELCLDNAAMVAALGARMLAEGDISGLDVDAAAILPLGR